MAEEIDLSDTPEFASSKQTLIKRLFEGSRIEPHEFHQLDKSLIHDKQIVIKILKNNNALFQYVPSLLKDDDDVAYAAIHKNGYPFIYASERLRIDRKYILEASKNGIGENFQFLNDKFKNDFEIAAHALNHDPYGMIEYIGDSLKSNFQYMLLAISHCGDIAAFYCSQELLSNKDFVLKAIEICPNSYLPISNSENPLSIDKDIIIHTLTGMLNREYYRTIYLFEAISDMIKSAEINDNEILDLLIKVKNLLIP